MARVCAEPGCPTLTDGSRCAEHERERKRRYDERRPSARQRGYDSKWEQARKAYLAASPFCRMCGEPATEVDHIVPHKGDQRLFWDRKNWQPLCKPHHSAKTMAELNGRTYKPKGCDEHGNPLDPDSHWNRR